MSFLNYVIDLKWEVLILFYFFRQNLIKNRYNHYYKNLFNQIALLSDFISPITSLSQMLPVIVVHVQSNNTATHSNNSGGKTLQVLPPRIPLSVQEGSTPKTSSWRRDAHTHSRKTNICPITQKTENNGKWVLVVG